MQVTQYDADLDRIVGQDLVQEMNGRDVLNCLLSMRRATNLYKSLQALAELYAGTPKSRGLPERPVAGPLAVLEMQVADFFDQVALAELPLEYHHLARLVLVLPQSYAPLDTRPLPATDISRFAQRLFAVLSVTHKQAAMSFSRGRGSSITEATVSTGAEILDPYYLTRATEAGRGFTELVMSDLWRGFWLLRGAAAERAAFPAAVSTAVAGYLGPAARPPASVVRQIGHLGSPQPQDEDSRILFALAEQLAS